MKNLLLGKRNFILIGAAVLLIVVGFILMSGGRSVDGVSFNEAIFSTRRIVIAPIVCLAGFVLMIFGIMLPPHKQKTNSSKQENRSTKNRA